MIQAFLVLDTFFFKRYVHSNTVFSGKLEEHYMQIWSSFSSTQTKTRFSKWCHAGFQYSTVNCINCSFRFGDFVPKRITSRVLAIIWCLISLILNSLIIGSLATTILSVTSTSSADMMLYGKKVIAIFITMNRKISTARSRYALHATLWTLYRCWNDVVCRVGYYLCLAVTIEKGFKFAN